MSKSVLNSRGGGDAGDIADGIRFAARKGAQVINLSLESSSDVTAGEIPELLSAVDFAHRRGALVIGASGNESFGTVAYPANSCNALSR